MWAKIKKIINMSHYIEKKEKKKTKKGQSKIWASKEENGSSIKDWKKHRHKNRTEYKLVRNEYVKTRAGEEIIIQRDVVDKCKEEPKLFYRHINEKKTNKQINKIKFEWKRIMKYMKIQGNK